MLLRPEEEKGNYPVSTQNILPFKGKWHQNYLLSHLKKIKKQRIKVYYKIFISILLREVFSRLNQRTIRHFKLIFNLINYVLVRSQEE